MRGSLKNAKENEKNGDFVAAVKCYQAIIDQGPLSQFLSTIISGDDLFIDVSKQAKKSLDLLLKNNTITADDMNKIAILYHQGDGVEKDYTKAREWYTKAKNKGSVKASRNLGLLFEHGYGVDKNLFIAAKYYQQALDNGYAEAKIDLSRILPNANPDELNEIGVMYGHGDDVNYDYEKCLSLLKESNEKGNQSACRNLGVLYERSKTERNVVTAAQHYQLSIEMGHETAQEDLNRLFENTEVTEKESYSIGTMYYEGTKVSQNYSCAKKWYEKANKNDGGVASYSLGSMYEHGLGVKIDLLSAANFYQQAIEKGNTTVEADLESMTLNASTNIEFMNHVANIYNNLGNKHYLRGDVDDNFKKAYKWHEKAEKHGQNSSHIGAIYRNLGKYYENGYAVTRNVVVAAKYYRKAVEKAFTDAQSDLNLLFCHPNILPDELNSIGAMYHNGIEVKLDYPRSKLWYEKAKEKGSGHASYNLGILYEGGLGVNLNRVVAAKYYEQAKKAVEELAQKRLDGLLTSADITADELYSIGNMYYSAIEVSENNASAKTWFEKAEEKGSLAASKKLGIIYKHGSGVEKDNNKAALHYLRSGMNINHFYIKKKIDKKQLKQIERENITSKFERKHDFQFLDEQDDKRDTALHRAAKTLRLKDCARLVLFNEAQKEATDGSKPQKKPFEYLDKTQNAIVTNLQENLTALIEDLRESTPNILYRHMIAKGGVDPSVIITLTTLHAITEIKPIMDLAKLAALGLHDMSINTEVKSTKISDENYDSDNEQAITKQQQLFIHIAPKKKTIEGIWHSGPDGLEGKSCYGVYTNKNRIYIGGKRDNIEQVRGTLIHELTHFAAKEAFKNKCNPFRQNDMKNEAEFKDIVDDARQKKDTLDPILSQAFLEDYNKNNQNGMELIVRTAELITMQGSKGRELLKARLPRLLEYYENVFLKEITNHVEMLEKRALGNWPLKLFTSSLNSPLAFQRDTTQPSQAVDNNSSTTPTQRMR